MHRVFSCLVLCSLVSPLCSFSFSLSSLFPQVGRGGGGSLCSVSPLHAILLACIGPSCAVARLRENTSNGVLLFGRSLGPSGGILYFLCSLMARAWKLSIVGSFKFFRGSGRRMSAERRFRWKLLGSATMEQVVFYRCVFWGAGEHAEF